MSNEVSLVKKDELNSLLSLYKHLHFNDVAADDKELETVWQSILDDKNIYVLCIRDGDKLVSSCTLTVIKNLTRGAKPYGVIENVVTHCDYRNRGYGTKVLSSAVDIAKERNCYKLLLMTSRKEESTLRFYEQAGFDSKAKTGFVQYFKTT